ncbi:F390 synthetase-related protein [uncultured Microscilla sp.]|uniref:F390 synthetase-related protein n=1 Tax=uncultured Microscilla sp. TaxID=432653 RepID=UPI00262734FB|nr:F390 synthetase-related protein [uncultured Microscilla sp.]
MFFKLQILWRLVQLRWRKPRTQEAKEKLQQKLWKRLQKKVLCHSGFYRESAQNKQPLAAYPLMNKTRFMANFNAINTHRIEVQEAYNVALKAEQSRDFSPMLGKVTVGLSSGTSGNRGIFLATQAERAFWVAAVLDRVIGVSLKKRKVAFFLRANSNLYDSVKSRVLQFEFFDLYNDVSQHIARLNALKPHILVAQPSMLLELAQALEAGTLHIAPAKIISVAEVLYPEDKAQLERAFRQTIHQVYQCTEGFLASSCSEGVLHFHEDFLIIEKKYLDESHTRFHPVITDLLRSSQPVVRYELNDIIVEEKACPCGQPTLAIAQIEGRADDVLHFIDTTGNTVKIYPDFLRRAIIFADETIQDYTLAQTDLQRLELYTKGQEESFYQGRQGILDLLNKYHIAGVRIVQTHHKHHEKGDKLRRIKNELNEQNDQN